MKNAISALNVYESPKFPHLIGNRGRGTRWRRQIFDRKSWTCELGYGADTMFHRSYFLLRMPIRIISVLSAVAAMCLSSYDPTRDALLILADGWTSAPQRRRATTYLSLL